MNEDAAKVRQGWILFWLGITILVALTVNWIVRDVEPNALVWGSGMILVGYGDKLRRTS